MATPSDIGDKSDIFEIASTLFKGGFNIVKVSSTVMAYAGNSGLELSKKEINEIVQQACDPKTKISSNITSQVKDWVLATDGFFINNECHIELGLKTPSDKKTANKALSRLVKDGVLEKHGDRRGCYRLLDNELSPVDWENSNENIIEIEWPLDSLQHMVGVAEKNIIIVAGEGNSGKTAFMMDLAQRNPEQEIHYFSSEMGPGEFKDRVQKFGRPFREWGHLRFYEKSGNFDKYINPNAWNIIDYLELTDNFYLVGGLIRAIFDKLDKGMAFIALQKKKNEEHGRGGEFTKEKSRLYLSLSEEYPGGRCKIVKSKRWMTNINPNGYSCKYKLIAGSKFKEIGEWER